MIIIRNNFVSEDEKRELVSRSEAKFEAQLNAVSEFVKSVGDLHVIALSGPTCSGKTTTSAKLTRDLAAIGMTARVVSIDDFFHERGERELLPGEKVDYDSIDAIDFEYLSECVDAISERRPARIPRFDFVTGRRSGYYDLATGVRDVIIFEGIQAIYPAIAELFARHNSCNVYIRPTSPLFIDDKNDLHDRFFAPNDLRLMRRIVRDSRERGASPEFTFFIWQSVRENEEKNIFPFESVADVTVDSTLPYEVNVIKPYILPLLESVPKTSEFRPSADALIEKLAPLEEISYEYVPSASVYREFLG